MGVISANLQFNRGEHLLLDFSSYQSDYSVALAWALNANSNAAVGQYIYIEKDKTLEVEGVSITYKSGPYIVLGIGTEAKLERLQLSSEQSNITLDGYATESYVNLKISESVANVYKFKGSVASYSSLELIQIKNNGDVYNVEDTGDNYAWDNENLKWDKLSGNLNVDLTGYLKIDNGSEINPHIVWDKDNSKWTPGKIETPTIELLLPEINPDYANMSVLGWDPNTNKAIWNTVEVQPELPPTENNEGKVLTVNSYGNPIWSSIKSTTIIETKDNETVIKYEISNGDLTSTVYSVDGVNKLLSWETL